MFLFPNICRGLRMLKVLIRDFNRVRPRGLQKQLQAIHCDDIYFNETEKRESSCEKKYLFFILNWLTFTRTCTPTYHTPTQPAATRLRGIRRKTQISHSRWRKSPNELISPPVVRDVTSRDRTIFPATSYLPPSIPSHRARPIWSIHLFAFISGNCWIW